MALPDVLKAIRSPYERDITVIQGANFRRSYTLKVSGVALDLSGCTVSGRISAAYKPDTGAKLADFVCTGSVVGSGLIMFELSQATTLALTPGAGQNPTEIGVYEIDIDDGTDRGTVLRGKVFLHAEPVT